MILTYTLGTLSALALTVALWAYMLQRTGIIKK